ncbi:hypothetical protein ACUOFC_61590, partial [Escherichia sp. TWPC-MK]
GGTALKTGGADVPTMMAALFGTLLLDVAQKLNDPANKKYGIALPTAESVLTEQSFSQFALSNQANVFHFHDVVRTRHSVGSKV